MAIIDDALLRLKNFYKETTPAFWESINSEADARAKLIDPIFENVLGWPKHEMHLESATSDGFIDYRFTISGLNKLIVEAKKVSRDLGILEQHAGRHFKLNGPVFKSEAAKEGISQAIRYCGHKNAELACVTNGYQWFIFRGNRLGDGKDTDEGLAFVFGSPEAVEIKFHLFYSLLAYDSVKQHSYRGHFQVAEGQPIRLREFREAACPSSQKKFLPPGDLSNDIERLMSAFFREISGDDDQEARRACFITTAESNAAERALLRVSEDLRSKVQSLDTSEDAQFTELIQRVQEMQKPELILLVGTKGAGKTTFLDRFFSDVLPPEIREECVVVRVDLSVSGRDANSILSWLDRTTLELTEKAIYGNESPSYEEIQGMFWGEYSRWRDGPYKHLYDSDKTQFKILFGEHIEKRREDTPHKYLVQMLRRVILGHKKVPCLVFDNADHFDVRFQEEVFKFAYSIHKETTCLIIVPITDTTSWQLAKQGAMQSFFTETFVLPAPPTDAVLKKRIDFIEQKVGEEKPEKGTGYFLKKGIRFGVNDIKLFASCLQKVFVNTGRVSEWIGHFANYDIRRSLQLVREVVSSPHLQAENLLKAFIAKTAMEIDADEVKTAIVRAKYDIYPTGSHSFIQNVYNLVPESDTSPLIGVRILQLLAGAWEANKDNDARYLTASSINEYIRGIGPEPLVTLNWINALHKTGLVLSYNPTLAEIKEQDQVEISPSGLQHLSWGLEDWVYIESMSEVTPLLSLEVCQDLRNLQSANEPLARRMKIERFVGYLLSEDEQFCKVPEHELYKGQLRIGHKLISLIGLLSNFKRQDTSNRYIRQIGTVSDWKEGKGYGFIRPESGGESLFVHFTDLKNSISDCLPIGTTVEFDIVTGERGPKASAVYLIRPPE